MLFFYIFFKILLKIQTKTKNSCLKDIKSSQNCSETSILEQVALQYEFKIVLFLRYFELIDLFDNKIIGKVYYFPTAGYAVPFRLTETSG